MVPYDPWQVMLPNPVAQWQAGDIKITPLARFNIRARILSKEPYYFDFGSQFSPYDLALGWKEMSDSAVLDHMRISQGGRWYYYSWDKQLSVSYQQLEHKSANMHIIPANADVAERLDNLVRGDIIEINGYLVQVSSGDRILWKSSLTREDTGGGSCEIIYAERITVLQ